MMRVPARTPSHTLVCIISSPHPSLLIIPLFHNKPPLVNMTIPPALTHLPVSGVCSTSLPLFIYHLFHHLQLDPSGSSKHLAHSPPGLSINLYLLSFSTFPLLISLFMSSFPGNRHPSKRQALSQPQDSSPPGPSAPPAPSCGKKATKTKSTKQSSSIRKVINDVI